MVQARFLVLNYSATGKVAALAHALTDGARQVSADLDETADLSDISWANGLAIGSPTRFGGSASQRKAFLDTTGELWFRGALLDKVCTAFTSASTSHGGLESTILAINNHCYHWGSIIVPLGYPDTHIRKISGNPYGASFVSRSSAAPDLDALQAGSNSE